jgi:RNA polymerase sigma-70 factor (ECF subfamily)
MFAFPGSAGLSVGDAATRVETAAIARAAREAVVDLAQALLRFLMHGMSPPRDDRYRSGPQPGPESDWSPPAGSDPDTIAAALSERFRERLRYFAARRLANREAAEDVAQEVLRRTLEALREGRVENIAALPAFLFQTARHVCMHQGRSAVRAARAMERLGGPEEPAETGDPLTELIDEERRAHVREALGSLSEADRQILHLSYTEGLDAATIGERLQLTAGAVRVRRHRAIARLSEILPVTPGRERER